MAFTPIGTSVRLAVTSDGQQVALPQSAPQCRVWNKGPNEVRVRYGVGATTADTTDLVMPPGFMEVHTKSNASVLAAKCATGETATLDIQCGSGD